MFFRELRGVAVDDGGELGKYIRICLGRVRVFSEADLDNRETERPNVRRNGVCTKIVL